jgi:hypothetical protein
MKLSEVIAAFEQVVPNLVVTELKTEGDEIILTSDTGHELTMRRVGGWELVPVEIDYDGCGEHYLSVWNGREWGSANVEEVSDNPNLAVTPTG